MSYRENIDNTVPANALGQFMTPFWAAEALIERSFSDLSTRDLVLEPTCGTGAFLRALPADVPAIGVEIDADLAQRARRETGRQIITGDFRTVDLNARPTVVIGNPPYKAKLIEQILNRCAELLPPDGRVGLLLPAYFMQAAQSVLRYRKLWGIQTELVARSIYPRLSKPLVWSIFHRGRGTLVGLALYQEASDVRYMPECYRALLRDCKSNGWREVVLQAVIELGGQATLDAIYERVAPRRPTGNPWWREKVRQQCQRALVRIGPGLWGLPEAMPFQLEAA